MAALLILLRPGWFWRRVLVRGIAACWGVMLRGCLMLRRLFLLRMWGRLGTIRFGIAFMGGGLMFIILRVGRFFN